MESQMTIVEHRLTFTLALIRRLHVRTVLPGIECPATKLLKRRMMNDEARAKYLGLFSVFSFCLPIVLAKMQNLHFQSLVATHHKVFGDFSSK